MHFASADNGATLETGNVFDLSTGATPSAIRVWDTDTGESAGAPIIGRGSGGRVLDFMERQQGDMPIIAGAISPDGQHILVSTLKGLRMYDVATGQPVGELWLDPSGGDNRAIGVAFSADGTYVVSVDQQTSKLQFRDAKTGRPVGNPLTGHTGLVMSVAFTTDGNHIVSQGLNDGWMLWPGPNSWRDALCDKLTANLTRAEWAEWVSPTIEYQAPCPSLAVP
jgi:WD40 repeat protein